MRFNVLRSAAITLSMMGVCSVASAQYGAPGGYVTQPYSGYAPQPYLGTPQVAAPPQQAPNYQMPAKWSNFGVNAPQRQAPFQTASTGIYDGGFGAPESIPTPMPANGLPSITPAANQVTPVPAPSYAAPAQHSTTVGHPAPPAPYVQSTPVADGNCSTCNESVSPYAAAATQPWEGASYVSGPACGVPAAAPVRPSLFPWFGSFDILFFDVETNGKDRNLVSSYSAADPTRPYLPAYGQSSLDADSGVGYSLSFGRYFGCGQYGLGGTYFHFDPDQEMTDSGALTPLNSAGGGGAIRASGMPQYNGAVMDYTFDNGLGTYNQLTGAAAPYTLYEIIDGRAGQASADGGDANALNGGAGTDVYAEAVRFRARRDMDFQGFELNLFSFGLMGAQRAAAMSCGTAGCGIGRIAGFGGVGGYGSCGDACGPTCGPRFGFGGLGGPLVRPCHGKVQIVTSHGIRWFQFRDDIDFAYDTDGRAGYTLHDLYDTTSVTNDLIGYQFGSRLNYCLGSRWNLTVAGKFGIYGNQAEKTHRVGSLADVAYLGAMPDIAIDFEEDDTVLATLGELDFGVGWRVCNGVTARFGYRLMGVTGVATSVDNVPTDYSSAASASQLHADDSLLLHGLYVGTDLNW